MLIEQRNVNEVEPGKIQASFEDDASESYEVGATQDRVAAFFRYHLDRQGWDRDSTDLASDAELTLSYSMRRHSWTIRIMIERREPSGIARFQVRGRRR